MTERIVGVPQEVDDKVFSEYLLPHLAARGYGGRYTNKLGKVKEGSATFYRTDLFDCVACRDINLRESFKARLLMLDCFVIFLLAADCSKARSAVNFCKCVPCHCVLFSISRNEMTVDVAITYRLSSPIFPHKVRPPAYRKTMLCTWRRSRCPRCTTASPPCWQPAPRCGKRCKR